MFSRSAATVTRPTAVIMGQAFAEFDPLFFEEPVPPDNLDAVLEVKSRIPIPVAGGERYMERHRFMEVIEKGALDWLQPDLVWFPAQVPESYSYTLSAALRAGLPVVAPNLGAFAERLNGRAWTWVEPWSRSADEWLAFFQQLRQQHFIPGTPPQRALAVRAINPGSDSLPAPAQDATDWYRGPYLDGLLPAQATAPLPRELIERHLVATQVLSAPRGAVLGLLARLRALPALAPVARAIPPRWQARVKDWLQR